jgi:hypothetical protein
MHVYVREVFALLCLSLYFGLFSWLCCFHDFWRQESKESFAVTLSLFHFARVCFDLCDCRESVLLCLFGNDRLMHPLKERN